MKFKIFSDCHIGGPTPKEAEFEYGANVIYIGDNFEFKNILKKDLQNQIHNYEKHLESCNSSAAVDVCGNHGVLVEKEHRGIYSYYHPETKTLFIHGHRMFYNDAQIEKWENRTACVGRFTLLGIKIKNYFGEMRGAKKFSDEKIRIINNYVKDFEYQHNIVIKNIVFGHTHPKVVIDETHFGIRMINVPKGMSEIELQEYV